MKSLKSIAALIITFLLVHTSPLLAQDPNFHIYLCFGQSNMDGTGTIEAQDRVSNNRVKMLQDQSCSNLGRSYGTWYTATPPLSRCWNGLGPADQFGKEMAVNMPSGVTIGVVVTGYGGCDIAFFQKGAPLGKASYNGGPAADIPSQFTGGYAWMLDLAKKAQTVGVIKGIIFHQGETNTNDPAWKYKVQEIVNNLRTDLGIGNVPFLAGELLYTNQGGCCGSHNTEIAKLPGLIPNCQVVSSSGLPGKDNAHFTSASYRELGIRYATKMLLLIKPDNTTPTVAITAPKANSSVCSGTSVTIEATTTSSGSISKVDFYDGNVLLGSDNSFPYAFTWQNPAAGLHTLRAIATGSTNISSSPATVSFSVNSPTVLLPYMQINKGDWNEQTSAEVTEGDDLGIGPHPYDVAIGWSWTGPAGFTSSQREIRLAAITTDQSGNYTVTFTNSSGCKSALQVPVAVNSRPVINITSPENNSVTTGSVLLSANVTDPDGKIIMVEFLDGTQVMGKTETAPYSFNISNAATGQHTFSVRATDDKGSIATSSPVTVTVEVVTGYYQYAIAGSTANIYPNPSQTEIQINCESDLTDATIKLFDAQGAEVYVPALIKGFNAQVDVSTLKNGTYMILINLDKTLIRKQITVGR
jgi:hypothetical protein